MLYPSSCYNLLAYKPNNSWKILIRQVAVETDVAVDATVTIFAQQGNYTTGNQPAGY